jgi:WD40 repeat protein
MFYVVMIYLGPLVIYPSTADYAPRELVLNRFDPYGGRYNFAVSPAGKELITAGPEKIYWIADWDDKDRTRIATQDLVTDENVRTASYSGDGTRVVFFTEKYGNQAPTSRIAVYDAHTRKLMSEWSAPTDQWIAYFAVSQDGQAILSSSDDGIKVRNSASGELLSTLNYHQDRSWEFLASDGRIVMVCCDEHYKEYTVYESQRPYQATRFVTSFDALPDTQLYRPSLSTDGRLLALLVYPTSQVNVYRVSDGQRLATLERHPFQSIFFAFSPSGTFLAISYSDDNVILWKIDSAEEVCKLQGLPFYPIHFMNFGPDDKTLITRDSKATGRLGHQPVRRSEIGISPGPQPIDNKAVNSSKLLRPPIRNQATIPAHESKAMPTTAVSEFNKFGAV